MGWTLSNRPYTVTWRTENGPHVRHQQTVVSWNGVTVNADPPHGMTLRQWDCELEFEQLAQLSAKSELLIGRFGSRS